MQKTLVAEGTDGFCVDDQFIVVPEIIKGNENIELPHEIGHTLGLSHIAGTVMGKNSSVYSEDVDKMVVESILINAFILVNDKKKTEYKGSSPVPFVLDETGNKPVNFNTGKVKSKKI